MEMSPLNIEIPYYFALTGRIQTWLENVRKGYEDVLPVSCTTFTVEDSMEGRDGIEDSWIFTSHGLRKAAGVAINLSKLRPAGTDNGRGLVASGVVSFARFYSLLNEELRRGGIYKNGAITLFLDIDHDDIRDYLNCGDVIPWAKRAVYLDSESWNNSGSDVRKLLVQKVNNGEVWLAKKQYDSNGNRLYSNVCLEILIPHRGTCLLSAVNVGALDKKDIVKAFKKSMAILCRIHGLTGVDNTGHYLSHVDDRQVGLGVIGLSNFLARYNVKYADFVESLEFHLDMSGSVNDDCVAMDLAYYFVNAYREAAKVAKQHNMERAFTIAPTASMSYRYKDADGYTTSPEISPPLSREIDRDSDTFGVESYQYHPNCETASEVGWSVQWRLLNAWQKMMDLNGLGHSISANLWTSFTVTDDWITNKFLPSHIKTTYYRLPVDQMALDKSEIVTPEDEDKLKAIYDDYGDDDDDNFCPIDKPCEACGG